MTDWTEVAAIVVGPLAAIGISLWFESRRTRKAAELAAMTQLLVTRGATGDPAFTRSINFVPAAFRSNDTVMAAWEKFHDASSRSGATSELNDLLEAMMVAIGFSARAASRVARSPYRAATLNERDQLFDAALLAVISMGESAKTNALASTAMVDRLPPPQQ